MKQTVTYEIDWNSDTCHDDNERVMKIVSSEKLYRAIYDYDNELRSAAKYQDDEHASTFRSLLWKHLKEHDISDL